MAVGKINIEPMSEREQLIGLGRKLALYLVQSFCESEARDREGCGRELPACREALVGWLGGWKTKCHGVHS